VLIIKKQEAFKTIVIHTKYIRRNDNQKKIIFRRKERMEKIIRFFKDEEGLESVEYALLGVLIALGIIGGVTALAGWIDGTFTTIAGTVP
jgi:pilus assembly protein Flp/PilA